MQEKAFVRDVMKVGVPTCKRDTLAVDIARYILQTGIEALCVLDEDGNGIGLVGMDELVAVMDNQLVHDCVAGEILREGMPTLSADMTLQLAAMLMRDQKTRIAYLIHNSAGIIYPAAYLTFTHLLRYLIAEGADDLSDLGISARRELPLESFYRKRDAAKLKNLCQKS